MSLVALCYHKVGTEAEEGRRLNIHPHRLDSHVRFFARRRFDFVTGCDLIQWPKRPTVCFTFDDGFASTLAATEIFERRQAKMSIYIVSSLVGQESQWEGAGPPRPLADWDALARLAELGHEVGNHTATHARLGDLSLERQVEEIDRCRRELAERGFAQGAFCYPYGSSNRDSAKALETCGYVVGLALGKRLPRPDDPLSAIPRIVVAYSDALPLLLYRVHVRPKLRRKGG